jgi:hypothetical protein
MKKKKKKIASTPKKTKKKAPSAPKKGKRKTTAAPKKQAGKSPAKSKKQSPKKGTSKRGPALNTYTPDICVQNFIGSRNGTVNFQNIPSSGVTITQISGDTYPFSPVTGTNGSGLKYTNVASGGSVTIVVPAINQTYPYDVSCSCPQLQGAHSVTVNT